MVIIRINDIFTLLRNSVNIQFILIITINSVVLNYIFYNFFYVALRPIAGHGLLILEVSRSHTTHHSR
jgi:hypothetical protein